MRTAYFKFNNIINLEWQKQLNSTVISKSFDISSFCIYAIGQLGEPNVQIASDKDKNCIDS